MSMEKLKKCRICLVENVRMYVVANKNLQELYEKLTDVPFVTEDRRPTLACFLCCSKLKQCYQLHRKCLEAEELFTRMLNDDYETKPLINQGPLQFSSEFNITPTELISIVDVCQTESIAIKEELPDDIIEPKEEHQFDELQWENLDNSCLDVADIRPHHSESNSEDDLPLMVFKIEEEADHEVSNIKRRARESKRSTIAKKPKLDACRTNVGAVTAKRTTKERSDSKAIRITQKSTSEPGTYFKEPYECDKRNFNSVIKNIQHTHKQFGKKPNDCDVCRRSFINKSKLTVHKRIHTGERPYKCDICQRSFTIKGSLTNHIRIHTGEKPYECSVCQRSFIYKGGLIRHIRVHTGEKPYKCDVCQRSFNSKCGLKSHIRRIHTGEKPYECGVCQRRFNDTSVLKNHIRVHTGEKPYECDVCHRSFSDKGYLKNHIRIHTGEKPYKCGVCQRSFTFKDVLIKHIRIHKGKKTL